MAFHFNAIAVIELFLLAVECKKPFLDVIYGFFVIVMTRGDCPKKNNLIKTMRRVAPFKKIP